MNANKQNSFEQTHYNLFLKHIFLQVNEDMEEDGENPGEFSLAVVDVQSAALAQASAVLLDTQVIMI